MAVLKNNKRMSFPTFNIELCGRASRGPSAGAPRAAWRRARLGPWGPGRREKLDATMDATHDISVERSFHVCPFGFALSLPGPVRSHVPFGRAFSLDLDRISREIFAFDTPGWRGYHTQRSSTLT